MTPLRASQVETLRYIGEGLIGRTTTEVREFCSAPWVEHTQVYGRLESLRTAGYLTRHKSRFYLSQLGKEALASSGKERGE